MENSKQHNVDDTYLLNNLTHSLFHAKNYNFICENSKSLDENIIKFSEQNLDRTQNIDKIYKKILDIDNAIKIEEGLFEYSMLYCINKDYAIDYVVPIYNDKMNSLMNALQNSDEFKETTLKTLNPSYIGFLTFEKLFPEKWNSVIFKIEEKEQNENNISYSDAYKCYKCGESKCKIAMKQIRSADEPMTTFVKCLVCGNAFKFN